MHHGFVLVKKKSLGSKKKIAYFIFASLSFVFVLLAENCLGYVVLQF
jgi:hypothetical protein